MGLRDLLRRQLLWRTRRTQPISLPGNRLFGLEQLESRILLTTDLSDAWRHADIGGLLNDPPWFQNAYERYDEDVYGEGRIPV